MWSHPLNDVAQFHEGMNKWHEQVFLSRSRHYQLNDLQSKWWNMNRGQAHIKHALYHWAMSLNLIVFKRSVTAQIFKKAIQTREIFILPYFSWIWDKKLVFNSFLTLGATVLLPFTRLSCLISNLKQGHWSESRHTDHIRGWPGPACPWLSYVMMLKSSFRLPL